MTISNTPNVVATQRQSEIAHQRAVLSEDAWHHVFDRISDEMVYYVEARDNDACRLRLRKMIKWLSDCYNDIIRVPSHGFVSFLNALRPCLYRFVGYIQDYRTTWLLRANRDVGKNTLSRFPNFRANLCNHVRYFSLLAPHNIPEALEIIDFLRHCPQLVELRWLYVGLEDGAQVSWPQRVPARVALESLMMFAENPKTQTCHFDVYGAQVKNQRYHIFSKFHIKHRSLREWNQTDYDYFKWVDAAQLSSKSDDKTPGANTTSTQGSQAQDRRFDFLLLTMDHVWGEEVPAHSLLAVLNVPVIKSLMLFDYDWTHLSASQFNLTAIESLTLTHFSLRTLLERTNLDTFAGLKHLSFVNCSRRNRWSDQDFRRPSDRVSRKLVSELFKRTTRLETFRFCDQNAFYVPRTKIFGFGSSLRRFGYRNSSLKAMELRRLLQTYRNLTDLEIQMDAFEYDTEQEEAFQLLGSSQTLRSLDIWIRSNLFDSKVLIREMSSDWTYDAAMHSIWYLYHPRGGGQNRLERVTIHCDAFYWNQFTSSVRRFTIEWKCDGGQCPAKKSGNTHVGGRRECDCPKIAKRSGNIRIGGLPCPPLVYAFDDYRTRESIAAFGTDGRFNALLRY